MSPMRRLRFLVPAVVVSLLLVACGADDNRQRTTAPASDVSVVVDDMKFSPATIQVAPGNTVVWAWRDDTRHDVAFDDGPASPVQKSGTWERTFDRPGTARERRTSEDTVEPQ